MSLGRKVFFFSLLVAVPAVGSIPLLLFPAGDCRTVNFEMGPEDIEHFYGAVFRIDDGGDIGTAFLIDSTDGYLLTAKHCVKKTIADKSIAIIATTPALQGVKLSLQIIDSTPDDDRDLDLALLKVTEPNKTSSITALDIGLRPPKRGSTLTAMGYPTKYGDEVNTNLRTPPATIISSPSEDGLIEVSQEGAIGGSSGGPLVDSAGRAVGICRKEVGIGNVRARYAPISDAESLLNKLPHHRLVDTLDAQVIKHTVLPQDLILALKRGPGKASNVDLYSWARKVIQKRADYKQSADYFTCPIIRAMMHRELDDAVYWLGPFASQDDIATASLTVAERELSLRRYEEALAIVSPIAADLAKSPDLSVQIRSLVAQARSMAWLGKGEEAISLLESKAASLPPGSQFKAAALGEAAQINAIRSVAYQNGADDPMHWFDDVMDSYLKAEQELRKLGPSDKLAELYGQEASLFQKHRDWPESLDKLKLARETYREIGDFWGESVTLSRMAETADRFDASQAVLYGKQYLAIDARGPDAETITTSLLKTGAKPQDLPGLHPSGDDWVVTTTEEVSHGDYVYVPNPPCAQNVSELVHGLNERLQQFAGPAISQFAGPLAAVAKGDSGSAADRLLHAKGKEPSAQCKLICAVYPKDAKVKDVEVWAGEQDQPVRKCSLDSNGEFPCEVGWSKWLRPVLVQQGQSAVACGMFMNWSHNRNRTASMTVTFRPSPGWHADLGSE